MRDDCRGKETGRSCVGCIVDACVRGTFFFFVKVALRSNVKDLLYTRWRGGGVVGGGSRRE